MWSHIVVESWSSGVMKGGVIELCSIRVMQLLSHRVVELCSDVSSVNLPLWNYVTLYYWVIVSLHSAMV